MNLRRWEMLGLAALAVIVIAIPLSLTRPRQAGPSLNAQSPTFVGTAACIDCHREQFRLWRGSDHDLAMDAANDTTVLGDFNDAEFTARGVTSRFFRRDGRYFVWTEGTGGQMAEFEVTHVFGHDPLQQYLVPFPGGRLQTLRLTWDVPSQRWYEQYPDQDIPSDDWLHWTRGGQNWNGMCAECHSTNLRKGYDPSTDSYNTTWQDIDVGCEACHGPGSAHVAWAGLPPMARPDRPNADLVVTTRDLDGPRLVELCATCHSRRAELGDYDNTGGPLLDHMLPSLLTAGLYQPDGQIQDEVYVYGSFLQSKMYARGVRCSDCHDSHSMQLRRQGNDLCLQCHEGSVYDSADHHFHQQVFNGAPSEGALCVKCHMVEQPFMVIDWRADHSFRVPRPDLTASLGTRDACSTCHADKPLQWSIDAWTKWFGAARKPQFGTAFAAARAGRPEAVPELLQITGSALQPDIVRATALELLSAYPDSDGRAAQEAALVSDEPLLRHTAVQNIYEPDPRRRADLLAPLLADPLRAIRMAATSQLAGIDSTLLKSYQRAALSRGIDEYTAVMSYSLDFAASALNLGNLNQKLGHPAVAEDYFRLALRIDDLFLPAMMNLAVMLSGQGRDDEAEALLRRATETYPLNADPVASLGLLLAGSGRPDEGLTWLRRAAGLDPGGVRVRYNLGLLQQQMGQLDEAEATLREAMSLAPDDLDVMFALADHLARRDRRDEALAIVERMIATHPESPIGHRMKAALGG